MAIKQPLEIKRRSPRRANARATVEAIFEAAAQILESDGRAGLTTNRIAERAGVGIGSVYAYFEDKDAILLEMARRELDRVRDAVAIALNEPKQPQTHPVRRAIRALIAGYGVRSRARRILMETLFSKGGSEEMARPVSEIATLMAGQSAQILPPYFEAPSPIGLYVLTRAVDSVIRAATYEDVPFLKAREFEDALMRLVMGYFESPEIGA